MIFICPSQLLPAVAVYRYTGVTVRLSHCDRGWSSTPLPNATPPLASLIVSTVAVWVFRYMNPFKRIHVALHHHRVLLQRTPDRPAHTPLVALGPGRLGHLLRTGAGLAQSRLRFPPPAPPPASHPRARGRHMNRHALAPHGRRAATRMAACAHRRARPVAGIHTASFLPLILEC